MQRLHEDDLAGHVLQQGGWHALKFPAIADEDEVHVIHTAFGRKVVERRQGEALHPDREPLDVLARIREIQGEYNFAGQYQQAPAPLGGGLIKLDWFKSYSETDRPSQFDFVFQSWDSANKPTELSDFSVCTSWGVKKEHLYLLHVYRKRVGFPDLKRAVCEQAAAIGAKTILIEDRASGTQLIQELISEGIHSIQGYYSGMNKTMRMSSACSTIENGFVHLPEKAEWLPDFIREMVTFPNAKFDDQVDSTSQALDWFKEKPQKKVLGWIEYLKKQEHAPERGILPLGLQQSRPCTNCGGAMSQPIPGGLRCMQCGAQWLNPDRQQSIPHLNRKAIFGRR